MMVAVWCEGVLGRFKFRREGEDVLYVLYVLCILCTECLYSKAYWTAYRSVAPPSYGFSRSQVEVTARIEVREDDLG